jgi:TonB-linked SusC/RagA family outer membrane protein
MIKLIQLSGKGLVTLLVCLVHYTSSGQSMASSVSFNRQLQESRKSSFQTLGHWLNRFETRYKVSFMYETKVLENKFVAINEQMPDNLEDALNQVLAPNTLRFEKIDDRTYVIYANKPAKKRFLKELDKLGAASDDNLESSDILSNQTDQFQSSLPKTFERIVDVSVKGKVTNEQNEALPGVSVVVKGTTIGTATDATGSYSINAPENATLVFSFIGYVPEEIVVGNRTAIDVKLVSDIKTLGEVVVVGYGTQKQRELSTAVSSVGAKDIAGVTVTGLDQAMQGKMAGVQVTQNSGEPGGSVSVRIRGLGSINGSNEPLYIVDGVPYGSLNAINPNDIERIDVLKDAASAAIYGSRGTNGVVLITTKRAKAGKVQVSVDAYAGTQSALRTIPLLNGPQFAALATQHLETLPLDNNGVRPTNPAWSNPSTVPNTDWQKELFKTAPIQSYNVNISGGGEKSRSLLSVGYFDQGGIVAQSFYKRYTVRVNTDYDISSRFKVGLTLNGAFDEKRGTRSDGGGASNTQGGLITTAISHPTIPLVAPQDGSFSLRPDGSVDPTGNTYFGYDGTAFVSNSADTKFYPAGLSNPVYAYEKLREEGSKSQQLLAAAFGEYEIIAGLKVRSSINLTFGNSRNGRFWKSMPVPTLSGRGLYGTGSIYNNEPSQSNQWNWINTISYSKTIEKHNFSAIVGIDALRSTDQGLFIQTTNNPNDQPFVDGSPQNTDKVLSNRVVSGGVANQFALISYLGRVTYDYAGKYFLTANIRRDGSSNFNPVNPSEYQYGIFPSASVGWILSEEAFLTPVQFISLLKLRASYGTVGNQGILPFQYLSIYDNEGNRRRYPLGVDQTLTVGTYPKTLGVPDIRWEKSTQTNIGIDATFLNNSLTLTADYYLKNISDMLGYFPVPSFAAAPGNSILRNGFSMQNSGIELALGYNRRFGDVGFSTSVNFATLENKITKLTDNATGFIASNISAGADGGAYTRTEVDQRIANFYGYKAIGIYQNAAEVAESGIAGVKPGDRRYLDLNNDKVINDKDRMIIGNGLPKYTFGLTLNADYKGFDISVLLNGQAGVQIANQTKYWLNNMKYDNSQGGVNNGSTDLLQSWSGEGSTNTFTRNAFDAATSNRWFSTFNIENGAFLRVRNVQLGYTLPTAISQKVGMSRTRIYVAAQNLFTFTEYSGYDPEIGSRDSPGSQPGTGSQQKNGLQTGVDFGRYPVSRMFTAGVNLQF